MKTIKIVEMSDRELQEWIYRVQAKSERHLGFMSTVLTIYLILTGIGIIAAIVTLNQ